MPRFDEAPQIDDIDDMPPIVDIDDMPPLDPGSITPPAQNPSDLAECSESRTTPVDSAAGARRLSPNSVGPSIPNKPGRYTVYAVADDDWAGAISLPAEADDGDVIDVRSVANADSLIRPDNILHASTMRLETNFQYTFVFRDNSEAGTRKWVITASPVCTIAATSALPISRTPQLLVELSDMHWAATIALPATPQDRDHVTIRSSASRASTIADTRVEQSGPLTLLTGSGYALRYIAEKKKWIVQSSTDTVYDAGRLSGGAIPALTAPRTLVNVADGNWASTLTLPAGQPVGSRVVVTTTAANSFAVKADGLSTTVQNGETVAFIVRSSGKWERETVTIDLLLLWGDKATAKFGAAEMRSKLVGGLDYTNEALEKSGANFRYRAVSVREVQIPPTWTGLNHLTDGLRTLPQAQAWLQEYKADGIYYMGTQDKGADGTTLCGLAWNNQTPLALNQVAAGSAETAGCIPSSTMAHELGHNMGVDHARTNRSYGQGYDAMKTLLGPNYGSLRLQQYSTPNRYHPVTGEALGIPDKIDAVRAMNARSAAVSAFR